MQRGGAAGERESGDGALTQTDLGDGAGAVGHEQRAEKANQVGAVADHEDILMRLTFMQELLEVGKASSGGECV